MKFRDLISEKKTISAFIDPLFIGSDNVDKIKWKDYDHISLLDDHLLLLYGDRDLDSVGEYCIDHPEFYKSSINILFIENYERWNRIYDLYVSKYEALNNYDRTEESSITYGEHNTTNTTGSQENSITYGESTGESQNQIYAFNTITATNSDKQTTSTEEKIDTTNYGERSDTIKSNEHEDITKSRIYGNIGVTTSSQLLDSDWNLWMTKHLFEDVIFPEFASFYTKGGYDINV